MLEVFRDAWGVPHLRAETRWRSSICKASTRPLDRAWQLEVERHRFLGHQRRLPRRGRRGLGPVRPAGPARRHRAALLRGTRRRAAASGSRRTSRASTTRCPPSAPAHPEFAADRAGPRRGSRGRRSASGSRSTSCSPASPRKLWREQVARAPRRRGDRAVRLGGPRTVGQQRLAGPRRSRPPPARRSSPATRTGSSRARASTSRSGWPAPSTTSSASPSRAIPGIAHFGHTGKVAWAITNAMADYQDLYRSSSGGPGRGGGARPGRLAAGRRAHRDRRGGRRGSGRGRGDRDRARTGDHRQRRRRPISLRYPPRVTGRLGFEVLPKLLRATTVGDIDARAGDLGGAGQRGAGG